MVMSSVLVAQWLATIRQATVAHIRVSVGEEKWSDSETGKVIDAGHNAAVFVYFLCQNAITTHKTHTQARI